MRKTSSFIRYRDAKDSGLVVDVNYLFPEWANIWYENHRDNIAPTTQENYCYTLRILNEGVARRRIADVKPYDIEMFLKKLRQDAIARFSKAFSSETTDPDKPTDGACRVVQFPKVG